MELNSIFFLSIGLLCCSILLIKPVWGVWALLVSALLLGGTIVYFFPSFGRVRWGITLLAFVPFISSMIGMLTKRKNGNQFPPFVLFILFIIFLISVLSTILNGHYKDALFASKNFFPFFALPFAFCFVIKKESTIRKMMYFLLGSAFLQVPIALFQNFFYISAAKIYRGDSVTGTFGGAADGGGPNDALSIYLLIHIMVLLALAKVKKISFGAAACLSLFLAIPILFTNTKAIVIFFILAFIILFHKDFSKNLLPALGGLVFVGILVIGIFYHYYQDSAKYSGGKAAESVGEYVEKSTSYVFTDDKDKMSRFSSLLFWCSEHSISSNPLKMFLGHGLGSVRSDGLNIGYVQQMNKYKNKQLSHTALVTLLWDIGLIGTVAYISLFICAYFMAGSLLTKNGISEFHKAFLMGSQVAVAIFCVALAYKGSIIVVQSYSAYAFTVLGYISFWKFNYGNLATSVEMSKHV